METLFFHGKVADVCAHGDDVFVATDEALFALGKNGSARKLTALATKYTCDLIATESTVFWTEQVHPMQTAWRRQACAVSREGGEVRALTPELSFTAGLVSDGRDGVLAATRQGFFRFDRDATEISEVILPDNAGPETSPHRLSWVQRIAAASDRVYWSTYSEMVGVSRVCSAPILRDEGSTPEAARHPDERGLYRRPCGRTAASDLRVERESKDGHNLELVAAVEGRILYSDEDRTLRIREPDGTVHFVTGDAVRIPSLEWTQFCAANGDLYVGEYGYERTTDRYGGPVHVLRRGTRRLVRTRFRAQFFAVTKKHIFFAAEDGLVRATRTGFWDCLRRLG